MKRYLPPGRYLNYQKNKPRKVNCDIVSKGLFYSFIIQGKFPETLESSLVRFNGQFFFFKGSWMRWVETKILADELLRIYLEYLKEKH